MPGSLVSGSSTRRSTSGGRRPPSERMVRKSVMRRDIFSENPHYAKRRLWYTALMPEHHYIRKKQSVFRANLWIDYHPKGQDAFGLPYIKWQGHSKRDVSMPPFVIKRYHRVPPDELAQLRQ